MHKVRDLKIIVPLFLASILLVMLACQTLNPAPTSAPTLPPPTSTTSATEAPAALYQQVMLTSISSQDSGTSPDFTITTRTPALTGSNDPRVRAFNDEMVGIVNKAVADFRQNVINLTATPVPITAPSTFDVRYNLVSPPGNIFSSKFEMEGYVTGAAHPYHLSQTVNYDLEHGKDLALVDLFVPNSDYLDVMAKYCTDQLNQRDIGFEGFELGATAMPQNYRNWNITADGLMITFDEYQVAPYAAGPQTVIIPYGELGKLIQYQGPLTPYLP
jgi:hypothetical protein